MSRQTLIDKLTQLLEEIKQDKSREYQAATAIICSTIAALYEHREIELMVLCAAWTEERLKAIKSYSN